METPPEPTRAARIDVERIEELREVLAAEQFKDLIHIFLNDFPTVFAKLRDADLNRDAHRTAEWAHRLKGSASTLGGARLAQLFQSMEKQADTGDWDNISLLLAQADEEFAAVQKELQAYLIV